MRERRWLKYNVEALLQAMGMRNTKAAVTNPSCSLFQGQPENLLVTTLHVWDKPLVRVDHRVCWSRLGWGHLEASWSCSIP